jgi:hypothetical protein
MFFKGKLKNGKDGTVNFFPNGSLFLVVQYCTICVILSFGCSHFCVIFFFPSWMLQFFIQFYASIFKCYHFFPFMLQFFLVIIFCIILYSIYVFIYLFTTFYVVSFAKMYRSPPYYIFVEKSNEDC